MVKLAHNQQGLDDFGVFITKSYYQLNVVENMPRDNLQNTISSNYQCVFHVFR